MIEKDIGAVAVLFASHGAALQVLKDLLVEKGVFTDEEYDRLLDDYTKNFESDWESYQKLLRELVRKK